ncbi:hypothetical protein DFS34DRAFT_644117 [Phlyctochytrium arcticum]|nr:hypothetical protein DFS34DRAFT_644117 [Phlyctochytrium arcticum]
MVGSFDGRQVEEAAKTYLERHNLSIYIEDAVARLLDDRPENPARFLSEYFDSVNRGTNALLREFEYVKATPRNRATFVDQFAETLTGRNGAYSVTEYHHLVELICPDFPLSIITRAMEFADCRGGTSKPTFDDDKNLNRCKCSCHSFLPCLRLCLAYFEFWDVSYHALKETFATAYSDMFEKSQEVPKKAPKVDETREIILAAIEKTSKGKALPKCFIPSSHAIESGVTAACVQFTEMPSAFRDVYQSFLKSALREIELLNTQHVTYQL